MSEHENEETGVISFSEFLVSIPPSTPRIVSEACTWVHNADFRGYKLVRPEISLHCDHDSCRGIRFFRCYDRGHLRVHEEELSFIYVNFLCSNCRTTEKTYSIAIRRINNESAECVKFGEAPPFGPPTPSKLLKLIGPDRDLFLKGRRCENQGLGVGAFVYYRRVVESQKNRIVNEIIKVSERVGMPEKDIELLKASQKDFRFSSAVESIKDVMPQALLINGHNPLTLLYMALSDGLHDKNDEHCLELASSIRVVLGELADRLSQVLKDEVEINNALAKLMSIKGQGGN
ncbi:hypothetical protein ACF8C1_19770 [Pseudomonas sp. zjy_9]